MLAAARVCVFVCARVTRGGRLDIGGLLRVVVACCDALFLAALPRSDSMLEWADRVGLDKFDLVGHSLGGYLSANFAMRHPDRVANLVLVSPVGLPSHPAAQNMALESSSEPTVSTDDPANDAAKANSAGIPPEVWKTLPWQLRMIVRAWNFNVTPQGIVRMLGKYGPKVMSAAVGRRLGHAISDSDSAELVSSYLYHVTASAGSGEFAMNALLSPQVVNGRPGVYVSRVQPGPTPVFLSFSSRMLPCFECAPL